MHEHKMIQHNYGPIPEPEPSYPQRLVYLAGPITGLKYGDAKETWRPALAKLFRPHILPLSPMRVVSEMQHEQGLLDMPQSEGVEGMLINRSILGRDESDIRMADAVVANFLGAGHVSIGTVAEMGMAHVLRKPIILIMEDEGNVHEHPFPTSFAIHRTTTLEGAANYINHLLTPGV